MRTHFKLKICIFLAILLLTPMIMARTYEEPKNITSFTDLAQWENRVTGYKFGIATLLLVFIVSFVSLKGFESSQALTGCLFFTMTVAIGLRIIDLLNNTWTIGTIILCAAVVLLISWSSSG